VYVPKLMRCGACMYLNGGASVLCLMHRGACMHGWGSALCTYAWCVYVPQVGERVHCVRT